MIAVVVAISARNPAQERASSDDVLGESVGTVSFPVGCAPDAATKIEEVLSIGV